MARAQVTKSTQQQESAYDSPHQGREELRKQYEHWTGELGKRSIEAIYALIAGVWALSQAKAVAPGRGYIFAVGAVSVGLIFIGVNLWFHRKIARLCGDRIDFTYTNPEQWIKEFEGRTSSYKEFPFTKEIEGLGVRLGTWRFWAPVVAGIFFVLFVASLFGAGSSEQAGQQPSGKPPTEIQRSNAPKH
jgi:hypothetical protein